MAIPSVQGQKAGNLEVVKNLYDALQKNSITSNDIAAMTPTLKSEEVKSTKEVNERYTITLSAIVKNEWRGVSFKNLEYREIEQNKVLVTGTVSGRQPSECEGITTTFQHLWTLKDGEIIHFNEY
jgi:membrane-bound lytic murein transglycosylase MltF